MKSAQLEAEFQAELHPALWRVWQSTTGFAEYPTPDFVRCSVERSRQHEVGPIKYVERRRVELQIETFRQLEILGEGHVGCPEAWAYKCVAAKIAHTAQTRSTQDW